MNINLCPRWRDHLIDPKAKPTAYHSPIPVPIHWQDDVKAELDRDVRLGVLEPVPIGEPVTWCHRMVICAKKRMESLGGPLTFNHSTVMPLGKLTILNLLFIRLDLFPTERRKPHLMLGMAITVFFFTLMIVIIPPLSLRGAGTDIVLHLKDTLLQGMVTPGATMKL